MSEADQAADGAAAASLRRALGWVALAYFVFVVYGSLVPLNFHPIPWTEAWSRFASVPMLSLGLASRADLVANLLLFMPLAFLMRELCTGHRAPGRSTTLGLWLVCAALAVALEFTQEFFPGRTVSQNDIVAEGAGAALGLLLHAAAGPQIRRWLQGWWRHELGQAFAHRLLHGYVVLLLVFALMPFDLTLSPVEVFHKWREGRVWLVPFADLPAEPAQAAYDLLTDVLIWLPVGALWRMGGGSLWQALRRGLMLAAALEFLQLFVFTRVSSLSDVLTGGLGCAVGALCLPAAWRLQAPAAGGQAQPQGRTASGRRLPWLWLCAAWAMLMLAAFWFPFQFVWSPAYLAERVQQAFRVPFATYYMGSEYHALNELLRKMLLFGPGGLLWAGHVAAQPVLRRGALWTVGGFAALGLALVVESGQLLLPGKVADLTDVMLEAGGAWLGLALGRRLWATEGPRAPGTARAALPRPALGGVLPDLASVLLLAAGLWAAARLPGVPYNVKELLPRSPAGVVTALGLAAAAWCLLALPLLLQARWRARPEQAMKLVPYLPALCLPPSLLLVATAPRESLDDVVGSPVLGVLPVLELLGRYMALHAALLLAAIGAVWLVSRVASDQRIDLLPRWLIAAAVWALPLHAVVVAWAATDNLTELMRHGGGLESSALLFCGALALITSASSLAAFMARMPHARRLLVLAALAWPAAVASLWLGSEPALFKYGRVFSAAQFLLSSDRDHYAGNSELLARFGLACTALACLVVLLQWQRWRQLRRTMA